NVKRKKRLLAQLRSSSRRPSKRSDRIGLPLSRAAARAWSKSVYQKSSEAKLSFCPAIAPIAALTRCHDALAVGGLGEAISLRRALMAAACAVRHASSPAGPSARKRWRAAA